ncbi:MAG: AraC family transcriptional regulator [Victivallaceae bacterium]|nr:AraC family transcriptional regulator [Victivallaceae bacterium]
MKQYIKYYSFCDTLEEGFPPLAIVAAGEECAVSGSYRWNGMERGSAPRLIWQYSLAGEGAIERNGTTLAILPGQAMLATLPDQHCYFLPSWSAGWEFYHFQLIGSSVAQIGAGLVEKYGSVLTVPAGSRLEAASASLFNRCRSRAFRSRWDMLLASYEFIAVLGEWLSGGEADTGGSLRRRIQRLFDDTCATGAPFPVLDDMVKRSGYSKQYFERMLKCETGKTPTEFLQAAKISRACDLLLNTRMAVKEVAASCGFYDSACFCRRFREVLKTTPSAYRKGIR